VRAATPADVPGVLALYARLDTDDRYRRFFGVSTPSPELVSRWIDGPGGLVLVAVGGDLIVAEAGYAPTSSGGFTLGITVDPTHRGWLGPYLLDRLLAEAHERGVEAVVADVLATNRPMLHVLAARGYALLPSDDPTILRVVLGTSGPVPGWTDGQRRRAVVELTGVGNPAVRALATAGYDVVVCRGPDATRSRRWRCPALDGRPCPLAGGADVIVAPGEPTARQEEVVAAVRRAHPRTPICLLAPGGRPEDIVAAVAEAAGDATSGTRRR
jgi:hypothetical protein